MLLRRLREGDEATFAAVVISWTPALIALAERFVASREEAEDAVQDTWLAVIAGLERFEGRSGLRTWVISILIRRAQHTGRRERRSIPFSSAWRDERGPTLDADRFRPAGAPEWPNGWSSHLPRWDQMPENHQQAAELRAVVDAAITELPRRQQQVIVARDVWDCGSEEVCSMLKVSANYQRVLLHRARAHVRASLETYFVGGSS
ncbi:sigma-70 family RNA polymerase sigma factor [soil metagenome]